MNNRKIVLIIFSIAFTLGLNITGVSPVLGLIAQIYPDVEISKIQSLQTVTFGMLIVGSLTFGYLCEKFSKKSITLFGLIIISVCGIIPMIIRDFQVLFISRVVIGLGFGYIMPINLTIITDYLKEDERSKYIGLNIIGMGVGSMTGNLIGGLLAGINYALFYLVYLIPLVSFFIVYFFLEDVKSEKIKEGQEQISYSKTSPTVYVIGILYFVQMIFITAYNMNIGIYVNGYYENSASITGIMTGINAFFALIVGATFGKITTMLQKYTLTFSIMASFLAFLSIVTIKSTIGILICSALCGVSLSSFMARSSILFSMSVDKRIIAKASGIFAVVGNMGGFLAPYILRYASNTFFGVSNSYNQFIISLIGSTILLLSVITLTKLGIVEKSLN